MIAIRSPLGGSIGPEPLGASYTSSPVRLASDGLGNAYIAYTAKDDPVGPYHFRVRPPGGGFGAPELLPRSHGGAVPTLVASPDGDVAAIWWDGGMRAAFRPAGGTFGDVQHLVDYENASGGWAAAYSANGDLLIGSSSGRRVLATVRDASGTVTTTQVADANRYSHSPTVGIDDAGRQVIAWAEAPEANSSSIVRAALAQRAPGGEFGAHLELPRASGAWQVPPTVTVSRDGVVTVVYPARRGLRVRVGRTGETPRHLRSYYDNDTRDGPRLVASPSGNHVLLKHGVTGDMPATTLRSGDGPFGGSLDMRTDCGGVEFSRIAVGDGGQGAALVQKGQQMLLITDVDGTGTRDCVPDYYPESNPSQYDDDPYVPRTRGGPGSGDWKFEEDDGSGGFPAAGLAAGRPTIVAARKGQKKRTARVVVVCGKPCSISARAKIGFDRGKTLVKGSTRSSSKGKAKLIEVPLTLSAATARTIDAALRDKQPKRMLMLTVSVTVTAPGEQKQTRDVVTALNGPSGPF
jgi:hypothetical protein